MSEDESSDSLQQRLPDTKLLTKEDFDQCLYVYGDVNFLPVRILQEEDVLESVRQIKHRLAIKDITVVVHKFNDDWFEAICLPKETTC